MGKAIIAGVIAGIVGAAVWAGISYFASVEIGWIAIGVGALVGFAVSAAAGEENLGYRSGTLAVVIACLAIVGGKWATVEFAAIKAKGESEMYVFTDEDCKVYIADATFWEWTNQGRQVNFPSGSNNMTASTQAAYPRDLWREAESQWGAMDGEEQEAFRTSCSEENHAYWLEDLSDKKKEAFVGSFGLLDIVFFLFAIVAAFKIGANVQQS